MSKEELNIKLDLVQKLSENLGPKSRKAIMEEHKNIIIELASKDPIQLTLIRQGNDNTPDPVLYLFTKIALGYNIKGSEVCNIDKCRNCSINSLCHIFNNLT